jgi:hypothetical protein
MQLKLIGQGSHNSIQRIKRHLATINDRAAHVYNARNWKESALVASVWFFIALYRALPDGLSTKIPVLNIENNASPEKIRNSWGQGDAGSLLDIAITWADFQKLDPVTQYWIPHLWAPGLSILEVPLIWISRIGVPIFWSLLILTLAVWSFLLSLIWRHFSQFTGRLPMIIISIGLLWSWDFAYLLKNYIFYTEGIGFSFLLIGLILLSIKVISPHLISNRYIYVSGILIGLSIWIRHTNESGLNLLFVSMCGGYFISTRRAKSQSTQSKRKKKRTKKLRLLEEEKNNHKDIFRFGAFTSGLALLVTLPWRLISTFHFQGAPFLMSSASGSVPATIWSLPNSPSGLYWGSYGSNWACKIDLERCYQLQSGITDGTMSHKQLILLAVKSILENPISYIQERSHFLWVNWIPNFSLNFSYQNLVALVFMILSFYCLYLCLIVKDKRKYSLIVIWGAFLIMNLAQLAIIHYESRYFIPVRLFILGLLLSLLSLKVGLTQSAREQLRN